MKKLDYKKAGVDIDAGNQAVARIKKMIPNIGSFGGLFPLDIKNYQAPVLVSATDGVGTKLKLAFELDQHDTIGIDLVAMSVNDILTCGAQPLFFLDYIACHKVDPVQIETIVKGIVTGCQLSDCALIGGETAELGDMYTPKEYDLAGFAVGVVEKSKIIDGSTIKPGDKIIGLYSSGLHSNGYSLARKVLGRQHYPEMLTPTKIYVQDIKDLRSKGINIKGIAHITGGGLIENIPRILPQSLKMKIDYQSWQPPEIFQRIQKEGSIDSSEMYRVFNMGIGLVIILDQREIPKLENPLIIGEIY